MTRLEADDGGSSRPGRNQSGLRVRNERFVLSLVRRHGALAKSDLARKSGLSAQAVSVIMRSLEADGLLVKCAPVRGRVGQPSVPMRLAADGAHFLGLKVGRRSLELVLTDFLGTVIARRLRVHPHPSADGSIAFAREAAASILDGLPRRARSRIGGMGVAMPFLLWEWATALGIDPGEMADWRARDLGSELEALFDFPVHLANDATAACGAELLFGAGSAPSDFIYFYVGFFVGGGVVIDGEVFAGRTGNAGALGSIPVPGANGHARQLIDAASLCHLESTLREAGIPTESMWETVENLPVGGVAFDRWLDSAAEGIAHAAAAASAVLAPRAVLIDGWLPARARAELVRRTRKIFRSLDMRGVDMPEIGQGTIGPDARALGAAALALSRRYPAE